MLLNFSENNFRNFSCFAIRFIFCAAYFLVFCFRQERSKSLYLIVLSERVGWFLFLRDESIAEKCFWGIFLRNLIEIWMMGILAIKLPTNETSNCILSSLIAIYCRFNCIIHRFVRKSTQVTKGSHHGTIMSLCWPQSITQSSRHSSSALMVLWQLKTEFCWTISLVSNVITKISLGFVNNSIGISYSSRIYF